MPQAALPDLNTAYITYRREVLSNIKSKNYPLCYGALYNINALLPDEYVVTISDQLYLEATNLGQVVVCLGCQEQTDYLKIEICNIILTAEASMLTGQTREEIWFCSKCRYENQLARTEPVKKVLKEPYFLKVVPKPPHRKTGLMAHSEFDRQVISWILQLLAELEHQMGRYRTDNWSKGDDDFEDNLDTSDEDQE